VQGSDGNFYGTTQQGGASTNCTSGCGTVFRISLSGNYTNLYSFVGPPSDGALPDAALVQGSDGNFYGTTVAGGMGGSGTVFRISLSGNYTNLYSFANSPDGANPYAGLIQGSDGNFYGTTLAGGVNDWGIVFRISPSGSLTNLHSFAGPPDGARPFAGLIQGSDGSFYGTTYFGGTNSCACGTVFRIGSSGNETILYSFAGPPNDGAEPIGGLVPGSDGNFYGTTFYGGMNNGNYGTVFRISPNGDYTNLYSFTNFPDGAHPFAGLVQGSDGNFYGTAYFGGASTNNLLGLGIAFRISPSGNYTNLHSFGVTPGDGINPPAALVQGSDGNFYGTTDHGGTVFQLTVPLSPPANQISGIQTAGNDVAISIPSVASETYQLQFTTDPTSGIWSNIPGVSVTNSIGALLTLTNFGGAVGPQGFYRFDITP
jgi:uncharacterized repeat protein (TIGR03803 family)